MTIAIIKYGMGNVASVQKVLKKLGYNSIITNNAEDIRNADLILLPGVGSFKKGMENLKQYGLIEVLNEEVLNKKKPFIGICLGMQLLATYGNEPTKVKGLNFIKGEVIKINSPKNLRVPHLGWNSVNVVSNQKSELYKPFNKQDFYFIHSYHFKAEAIEDVCITVNYDLAMVAGLQKDNIYAMQFHPEKSQEVGLLLLKTIIDQYA